MLTRNGWVVVLIIATTTSARVVWGYVDLGTVAIGAAATLLPGLIWRLRRLAPYEVELAATSATVHRGDHVSLTVRVRRAGRGMMPAVRVAVTACGPSVQRMLRPRGEVWAMRAARRGRQVVMVVGLSCQDPFGLWWRRADVSVRGASARIISVLPRLVPLRSTRTPVAGRGVSQRHDRTVRIGPMAVLLDVHRHPFEPRDGQEDPFELAVDLAFSMTRSAAGAGLEVSLLTNAGGQTSSYADPHTITDVLTGLPACAAYPGCSAAPSLRAMVRQALESGDGGGLTVIVSAASDAATVVSPLAGPAARLVLFQVLTSPSGRPEVLDRGGLTVIKVTSLAEAAQAWARELTP